MVSTRPIEDRDQEAVTELLVAAFRESPGYQATFGDNIDAGLRAVMPRLLRMRMESGRVRVAERDGRILGVLSEHPSSVRFGVGTYLRHGLLWLVWELGRDDVRRLLEHDAQLGALRHTVQPPRHHSYLAQIAAHPDAHGTGVGTALMREYTATLEATRQESVLLTTKSANVGWYERFGYRIVGQAGISKQFTAWCMLRGA